MPALVLTSLSPWAEGALGTLLMKSIIDSKTNACMKEYHVKKVASQDLDVIYLTNLSGLAPAPLSAKEAASSYA